MCDTATLTITVKPVNDAPVATSSTISTQEDKPVTGTLATSVTNVDGGILTFSPVTNVPATQGVFILNTDGTYTFTPAPNFNGTVVITYQVCNASGLCVTSTLTINVTPVNDKPIVTPLSISTIADSSVTVCTTIHDVDASETFTKNACGVNHGTAKAVITGNQLCVSYTPNAGYSGQDTACFIICDAYGACDTIKIPISISAKPLDPCKDILVKDSIFVHAYSLNDSTDVSIDVPLKNINQYNLYVDGKPYTSSLRGCNLDTIYAYNYFTVPSKGKSGPYMVSSWVINKDTFTGSFNTMNELVTKMNTWDAAGNWVLDSTSFSILGGNKTNKYSNMKVTRPRDGASTIMTVNTNVTPKETCLTVSKGTHQLVIVNKTSGCDDTTIMVITLDLLNRKPLAVNDTLTVKEDEILTSTVATNDKDIDGNLNLLSFKTVDAPKNGAIVMNPNGTFIYTPKANFSGIDSVHYEVCDYGMPIYCAQATLIITVSPVNDKPSVVTPVSITVLEDSTLTFCTTISDVDLGETFTATTCGVNHGTATATISGSQMCISYTPAANYNGRDTLCFVVCDAQGACDTVHIPVSVSPVNDKPIVTPVRISTIENTPATVCTTVNDIDLGETFKVRSCGVNHGSTSATIVGNQLCITYSPSRYYSGLDTVCFIVCDASGACDTVRIPVVVSAINDKPSVTPLPISATEDTPATVCTTINDADTDDTFTASPCGTSHGITTTTILGNQLCVTYTPNADYNGRDTACIIVCDKGGLCDTLKIPITVKAVNDTPSVKITPVIIAADSTRKFCFAIEDKDVTDTHTVTLCGTQKGAAVVSLENGQVCITYKAPKLYSGQDTICITICDNSGACRKVLIPITVTTCNDQLAPRITCPTKMEVSILGTEISDPSQFIVFIGQNRIGDNCNGVNLVFDKVIATDDCGETTVSQIAGPTRDSVFRIGSHFLTFEAKDNSGKTSQCQTEIVVSPIQLLETTKMTLCPNEALTLKATTYNGATYKWNGPRNISNEGVLLTVPRATSDNSGLFVVSATVGSCTFRDSITVNFTTKPTTNNDTYDMTTNTELKNTVLLNDSINVTQKYTVKLVSSTSIGKLVFNTDGSFVYQPRKDYTGLDNFIYEVCLVDCPTACEKATVTIKVIDERNKNKGMNVISPNGDGVNDGLEIEGFDPDAPNNQSEIVIYNQWGNVVYRTTSYRNDWKGTFKDAPLPDGTYYYVFKKSPDATPIKDFVTIIR